MTNRPRRGLIRGRRMRKLAALLAAHLPGSELRKLAYRLFHGYKFGDGTIIAGGTYIAVDRFVCGERVTISRGNRFYGPIRVEIGRQTFIGPRNQIMCGDAVAGEEMTDRDYGRALVVGDECLINEQHLLDVVGTIRVGNGTWLAGFRSQFMTHGASVVDRNIHIGERCFFGSAVLMAPGSAIGADCIVAMGSVVTKKISGSGSIISGVPARIARERTPEDQHAWGRTW